MSRSLRSRYLSASSAIALSDAADLAYRRGHPLNKFISINFDVACVDRDQNKFMTHFIRQAGDWMRLWGEPLYYVWVLENPPGGSLNCHIFIHVPLKLKKRFAQLQRGWLKAAGGKALRFAMKSKSRQSRFLEDDGSIEAHKLNSRLRLDYCEHMCRITNYMIKGVDPATWAVIARPDNGDEDGNPGSWEFKDQGVIYGKRAGTSETLGPKARAAFDREAFEILGGRPARRIALAHAQRFLRPKSPPAYPGRPKSAVSRISASPP